MKRRKFTNEFKAKVAIEAIKVQRTVNELVYKFEVHPSQIAVWKKQLLEAASDVFRRGRDLDAENRAAECERLYCKDYETIENLIAGFRTYFRYYNHERSHQSLEDRAPC